MATITSYQPIFGVFSGGDTISFVGTGFQTGVTSIEVTFNGVPSPSVVVTSDTNMTAVVPELPAAGVYPLVVVTNLATSSAVPFYATEQRVPSGDYSVNNPYFDPTANFTVFGVWNFAQAPIFPGGGGSSNAWLLGGNTPAGPSVFGTLNNNAISFEANSNQYMRFEPTFNRLTIPINNFHVDCNTGVTIECAQSTTIDGLSGLGVGNIGTPFVNVGNNSNPANFVNLVPSIIQLSNIPASVTSELIYYDSTSKQLSYGAAGSSGGEWLLAGNAGTGGTAKLGTLDNQPFNIVVNNANIIEMQLALVKINSDINVQGGYLLQAQGTDTGNLYVTNTLLQLFAFGTGTVQLSSTNSQIEVNDASGIVGTAITDISFTTTMGLATFEGKTVNIESHGNMIFQANDPGSNLDMVATNNATFEATGGILRFNAPALTGSVQVNGDFKLNTIANVVTSSQLYYNTTTKSVTFGTASTGPTDWHVTGNSGTGGTGKLGTLDSQPFTLVTNNIARATFAANGNVAFTPNDFSVSAAANLSLICVNSLTLDTQQSIFIGQVNTAHVFIGKAANDLEIVCTSIAMPNIPNASKPHIIFYDTTSKLISYDVAGTSAGDWLLAGNTGAGHVLGTTTANGFAFIANSLVFATVLADKSFLIDSGPLLDLDASQVKMGNSSANVVNIGSNTCTTLTVTAINQTFAGIVSTTIDGGTSFAKMNGAQVFIGDGAGTNVVNIGHTGMTTCSIAASDISLGAGTGISLTGPLTTIASPTVTLIGIPAVITSDVVFIHPTTKALSYGPIGTAAAGWVLAGNSGTGGTGLLGTLDAQGFSIVTNNSQIIGFAANKSTTMSCGPLFAVTAATVNIGDNATTNTAIRASNAGNVLIDGDQIKIASIRGTNINIGSNAITTQVNINAAIVNMVGTSTGILDAQAVQLGPTLSTNVQIARLAAQTVLLSSDLRAPNIPNSLGSNILYFNSSNGVISYGAPPAAPTVDWHVTGNSGTGGTGKVGTLDGQAFAIVANNINMIQVSSTALTYGVAASTAHSFLGASFSALTTTSLILDSATVQFKQASSLFLQATAGTIEFGHTSYAMDVYTNTNLRLRNVPPATKPNILFIDQADNGKISYGPANAGAVTQVITRTVDTVGVGSFVPTVGMLYVTVEVLGGGASGAGTTNESGGAGGGAGGYSMKTYSAADIGPSLPYVVGSGGPPSATVTPGGNTTFGSGPTLITGGGAPAITGTGTFSPGGQGGAGVGGDFNVRGSCGGPAFKIQTFNYHGQGGASIFGGMTPGGGVQVLNQNGAAGVGYGSGGEGGVSTGAGSSLGGAGVSGVIRFTEYISA